MADILPNMDLKKKRLLVHISEMELMLERYDLRKLEIQDELRKIEENIQATQADIKATEDAIAGIK